MNATLMLICLTGAVTAGQKEKVVFQAPHMQVRREREDNKDYLYLMYHRTYIGRNYAKPSKVADLGNPDRDFSRLATTYYHPESPVGIAMRKFDWFSGPSNTYHADARLPASLIGMGLDPASQLVQLWSEPPIAVLGLEAGTMASYARPGQTMHFTERVPAFVQFSAPSPGKQPFFHFVPDALNRGACIKIWEGEPRETFAKQGGEAFYHLISIEVFKEAVHTIHKELITREGVEMLMSKLHDDGVLMFHTSNRYYNLVPILASVADDLDYACVIGRDRLYRRDSSGAFTSEWVAIARKPKHLAHLRLTKDHEERIAKEAYGGVMPYWSAPDKIDPYFVWTDKGENSFRGILYSDPAISEWGRILWDAQDFLIDRGVSSPGFRRFTSSINSALSSLATAMAKMKNGNAGKPTATDPEVAFRAPKIMVKVFRDYEKNPDQGLTYHTLMFNGINVGENYLKPARRTELGNPNVDFSRLATTYHHPRSPVGMAMQKFNWFPGPSNTYHADARLPASLIGLGWSPTAQLVALWSEPPIAVLGLEVGTMASYARPGQTMHFTERLPTFVQLSMPSKKKEPFFQYVQDAKDRGAFVKILEGEPRPTFAKHGGERFYHLIAVDTYKEAVYTVHKDLLTKEGMQMLMSKLHDDGILCFHVSNRHYDLVPIIAAVAKDLKYAHIVGHDLALGGRGQREFSSDWVLVARAWKNFAHLKPPEGYEERARQDGVDVPYWSESKRADARFVWTDKGENSLRGLYRTDPFVDQMGGSVYALESFLTNRLMVGRRQAQMAMQPLHAMFQEWSRATAAMRNREAEDKSPRKE